MPMSQLSSLFVVVGEPDAKVSFGFAGCAFCANSGTAMRQRMSASVRWTVVIVFHFSLKWGCVSAGPRRIIYEYCRGRWRRYGDDTLLAIRARLRCLWRAR